MSGTLSSGRKNPDAATGVKYGVCVIIVIKVPKKLIKYSMRAAAVYKAFFY